MSEPILTQADDVRYSVVEQDARKRLGLSYNQYHVADTIYHLSQCERGYCYMSIPTQAEFHDLAVRTIKNIIDELIALGFIEKVMRGGQTVGWKTTQAWYGQVIVAGDRRKARYAKNAQSPNEGAESAQSQAESVPPRVQKMQVGSAESAPNINTNSNKDTSKNTRGTSPELTARKIVENLNLARIRRGNKSWKMDKINEGVKILLSGQQLPDSYYS